MTLLPRLIDDELGHCVAPFGGSRFSTTTRYVRYASKRSSKMTDTSVTKVNCATAPTGKMGQKYLASGVRMAMRLWEEEPSGQATRSSQRQYETIGYVISGRAELELEGQRLTLEPGDSWVVPAEARHSYLIHDTFTAVETTSPPARVHARDETVTGLE
jgi:quercetin dioxygenase-like cupin family protein